MAEREHAQITPSGSSQSRAKGQGRRASRCKTCFRGREIAWIGVPKLVGIADTLGDPPFGRFHRLLALAFSLFAYWVVGRYGTASRNCSATHRLLHFIANLIFPFRAQHTGTKGDLQDDRHQCPWSHSNPGTQCPV
uniref:Uncharacterized protein n=1 Tax=Solanum tuberosum TaxID=4113 RepID=M1A313_SOLTU